MIQVHSIFRVSDNSGAKKVKCIKVLGGYKRKIANIGDLVIVSIQKVKHHKKKKGRLREGEVLKALIVRTKAKVYRQNFSRVICQENSVALMTPKNKPLGTRILGPVGIELRHSKFLKVASLSAGLI